MKAQLVYTSNRGSTVKVEGEAAFTGRGREFMFKSGKNQRWYMVSGGEVIAPTSKSIGKLVELNDLQPIPIDGPRRNF